MSLKSGILVVGCILMSLKGLAQMPFYHYFEDTIRPGYRISGAFDSLDVNVADYQSTLPSAWRPSVDAFDLDRTFSSPHIAAPKRFSAITHVGLYYSIGSANSQKAGIAYTQSLTKDQFIQLNYQRVSGNGAMRSSSLESNHFDVAHLVRKTRYASQVNLLFDGTDRSLSGGLLGDSLNSDFDLIFQAVEKSGALLNKRYFSVDWANFISFTRDSLIKTGIYLTPLYNTETRRYQETGDIDSLYGSVNIDSVNTYDFWQRSEVGGTAGYFFHTNLFSINGGLKGAYWEFDNLDTFSDTAEFTIVSDIIFKLSDRIELKGNGSYNLAGAFGEKSLGGTLAFKTGFADLRLKASYADEYPENYQRRNYGNAYSYGWNNRTLVSRTKAGIHAQIRNRFVPVQAAAEFQNYRNFPFFINNQWDQDTLTNLSFVHFSLRADFTLGKFFIQPAIRVQSGFIYVPALQLFARAGFNGYLFKAKKLHAAIGLEGGYCSSYTLLDYVPMMDTYVLQAPDSQGSSRSFTPMPKLHVFAQFELGFLRWFIRVENIEQLMTEDVNQEALGYPVVPLQIRLGLSWDLFN